MKQINITLLFLFIFGLALISACGYLMGYHNAAGRCEAVHKVDQEQSDTTSRTDTASYVKPEPEKIIQERDVYVPYPVTDSSAIRQRDSLFAANGLLIRQVDSLTACLVRTRKEYQDSTFRAVVSGFDPSLDYIEVYPKETVITVTRNVSNPAPKWSFGLAAGPGIFVNTKGKVNAGGGIIVGVSYNF